MFEKIPDFITALYPQRIWRGPNNEKNIYLTFDDGPIPEVTPWVLDMLREFNAKATFFCIGDNVMKYPEIFNQIIHEDHAIGNHTHNHLNGWKTSTKKYVENVLLAEEVIKEKRVEKRKKREINFSNKPKTNNTEPEVTNNKQQITYLLFRPPYGRITGKQVRRLQRENYKVVMWDVLSKDYNATISSEKCFRNIAKNAVPGSIIVFHDSLKAEKSLRAVLPRILEYYSKKDFIFEKLS